MKMNKFLKQYNKTKNFLLCYFRCNVVSSPTLIASARPGPNSGFFYYKHNWKRSHHGMIFSSYFDFRTYRLTNFDNFNKI